MTNRLKIPAHIEIEVKTDCVVPFSIITKQVKNYIETNHNVLKNGQLLIINAEICELVDNIEINDLPREQKVSIWKLELLYHIYKLSDQEPVQDYLDNGGGSGGGNNDEELVASEQWELPNKYLNEIWNTIIINDLIKKQLLGYCTTSILFSDANINTNIISWNHMLLIYGPPGTGKTSICKGLAQKMFIRNANKYSSGVLLEINSHSLFSKWFSESGKLVMKLFNHIHEIADDNDCLVIILIDEVESITSSRSSASNSNEPGDAVRVVNAVLTSLDTLKRKNNVLVLCTSNMLSSVDTAFLDRIDMKIYLGPPNLEARYAILLSCLDELMNKKIIEPKEIIETDHSIAALSLGTTYSLDINSDNKTTNSSQDSKNSSHSSQNSVDYSRISYDENSNVNMNIDAQNSLSNKPLTKSIGCDRSKTNVNSQFSYYGRDSNNKNQKKSSESVTDGENMNWLETIKQNKIAEEEFFSMTEGLSVEAHLYLLAIRTDNMSGRALRKLPLKAHSCYLQRSAVSVMEYLDAMHAMLFSDIRNNTIYEEDV